MALSSDATPYGSVETLADARACADLFRSHRDEIDGVLVTLPNFGDERAVANTLRWADLDVPVLVHAFAERTAGRRHQHHARRHQQQLAAVPERQYELLWLRADSNGGR